MSVNANIVAHRRRQTRRWNTTSTGTEAASARNALVLNNAWQFFMGYRFAIFNYATQALGGAVIVRGFDLTTP